LPKLVPGSHRQKANIVNEPLNVAYRYGVIIVSLLLVLAGGALLLVPDKVSPFEAAVGTTLLATGIFTVMWNAFVEHWQTERLQRMMSEVVSASIAQADLQLITAGLNVFGEPEFASALSKADELFLGCLYDQRWTEGWADPLERVVLQQNKPITFCVPDPTDIGLMERLASRHGLTPQIMTGRVANLLGQGEDLQRRYPNLVTIRTLTEFGPSYTSYLFHSKRGNGLGVTRVYGHRMGTGTPLLELMFHQGGSLYKQTFEDYRSLCERGHPHGIVRV
jgi:hypothetical protein